jgi:2-oxoglutarate/2-oxoacid ferredoxin oxidoreductase subunit alpha
MNDKKNSNKDVTIRIGGAAGQGMNSIGGLLGRTFVRSGLWTFIHHNVMSRIRGGHNFTQIRVCSEPVNCPSSKVNILVCLDKNTFSLYRDENIDLFIFDKNKWKNKAPEGDGFFHLPMEHIAENDGGDKRMANTVAAGAVLALLNLETGTLEKRLEEIFSEKGDDVIKANQKCALAGFDYVKNHFKGDGFGNFPKGNTDNSRMLMTASEAMALGGLAGGLRFYAAYPMSPATAVMEYLASKQEEFDIAVEQAEDEIAAVNMVIGSFFAGAPAITGTSGGGLALMMEGISLAGMTETPLVIIDAQRPAPATGMPTRTEQGDLLFAVNAGHGEFPRIILAPADSEEAFHLTAKALYLAGKYQTPVLILGDQYLNDSSWTVESISLGNIPESHQSLVTEEELYRMSAYEYNRYRLTDSGITPRLIPGTPEQVLYADSDEHTEAGHITESADVRKNMVDKRQKKNQEILEEMSPPKIFPDDVKEEYLLSWGSNFHIVEESRKILAENGRDLGHIHFSEIYPIKKDTVPPKLVKNARFICIENNATAQLSRLLKMEINLNVHYHVLNYDGRPFTPQKLAEQIKNTGRLR